MKQKKITIICADETSDLATIAIRSALEYFGYVVSTHWVGNKRQFIDLLQGKNSTDDVVVISAHGTEGKFFLSNEESVSFKELKVRLPRKTVISTGCETHGAAKAFMKGGCNIYIAPAGSPEGNDANFFVIKYFWLLAQGKNSKDAFEIAAEDMPKGSEFTLNQNPH